MATETPNAHLRRSPGGWTGMHSENDEPPQKNRSSYHRPLSRGVFGPPRHPKNPRVPLSSLRELPGSPRQGATLLSGDPSVLGPCGLSAKTDGSPARRGVPLADVAGQLAPFRKWDPWVFGMPGRPKNYPGEWPMIGAADFLAKGGARRFQNAFLSIHPG